MTNDTASSPAAPAPTAPAPEEPLMYLSVSPWFPRSRYEGLGRHRKPSAALWRKLAVAAVLRVAVTW